MPTVGDGVSLGVLVDGLVLPPLQPALPSTARQLPDPTGVPPPLVVELEPPQAASERNETASRTRLAAPLNAKRSALVL